MRARHSDQKRGIPLWVKITYTAFMAILVPCYWVTYSPWNFLYFCDVAILMTLVGVWMESPLIVSMPTVGIVLPQALWVVDFLGRLITGAHITGVTKYMFDAQIPLFLRGLSSFHGWLPFFLLWLVWCLGYDRRALLRQIALIVAVMLVSYTCAPPPPPSADHPTWAVNVNYAYGLDDQKAQTMMAPTLWLILVTSAMVALCIPTHLVLRRAWPDADRLSRERAELHEPGGAGI